MGKGRVEAFSDGVFAVAITILVLDLKEPAPGHGSVAHQLGQQWPHYVAYVVSFAVIGIIWVNHHTLFAKLARVDRTMLFLNLVLLLFVVLIPFPTAVVAEYIRHNTWDARVAMVFYSLVMEGMGLAFTGIYVWAGRHRELLHPAVDAGRHQSAFRQFGLGSVAYLVLAVVAVAQAQVALAGHFALACFYVFDRTAASEVVE